MKIHDNQGPRRTINAGPTLRRVACVLLLGCIAAGAHAASIYKCVYAHGPVAFRDTPCATHARQTKLDVAGLPLIDPDAPRHRVTARAPRFRARRHTRRASAAKHGHNEAMSWECRAADGEVFYRHARCPGSVRGDGVVRWQDGGAPPSGKPSRHRRNAWGGLPVHGRRIPRSEACRRIHSAGAAVRDGHQRDAHVSTYDHLMGRDPCAGM